jgi:long-chain acyl-CoA synthetase
MSKGIVEIGINQSRQFAVCLLYDNDAIAQAMEENRINLNTELPAYSQIARVKIYPEEFEKTPKKSIKRFLYQEVK